MEGVPTFFETTSVVDFVSSSDWMPYYDTPRSEFITFSTKINSYQFDIDMSEEKIYGSPSDNRTSYFSIMNLGANKDTFLIEFISNDLSIDFNQTMITIPGNSEIMLPFLLSANISGEYKNQILVESTETGINKYVNFTYFVSDFGVDIYPDQITYQGLGYRASLEDKQIYSLKNVGKDTDTYTISIDFHEYFKPSIQGPGLSWDYYTYSTEVTLESNEEINLTFTPRISTSIDGKYPFVISVISQSDPAIIVQTDFVYIFRSEESIVVQNNNFSISNENPISYNFSIIASEAYGNYTFVLSNVPDDWHAIFRDETNQVLLIDNGEVKYYLDSLQSDRFQLQLFIDNPEQKSANVVLTLIEPYNLPSFGILPFIVGTISTVLIAVCIAVPLGLGIAIFLAEYCPFRIRNFLKPLFELLAGIPSVIYGLWGFITLGPFLSTTLYPFIVDSFGSVIPFFSATENMGSDIFTASIILSIMILPIILTLSEDSIRAVPHDLKEGSLALGSTRWQTMKRVILPVSKSGIISSVILGTGRAIGETMAVLMIMQYAPVIPSSIFDNATTMTGVIATQLLSIYTLDYSRHALFAVALILFFMIFVLNTIIFFLQRPRKKRQKNLKRFKEKTLLTSLFLTLIASSSGFSKKRFSIVKNDSKISTNTRKKFNLVHHENTRRINEKSQSDINGYLTKNESNKKQKKDKKITGSNSKKISFISQWTHLSMARKKEQFIVLILICGIIFVTVFLFYILGDIIINGLKGFQFSYLIEEEIGIGVEGGFLNAIIGSLQLVGIALAISFPLALGSAIYVQEYTKKDNIFTRIILFASDTLASTPSIVFGAFGYIFFSWYLGFRFSLLAGGFTLAFMVLPILIRSCIEALKTIPMSYKEGSIALGATKWQTIRDVVIPPAVPMIGSGVIIGIGRAIGETAAVLFTAGYSTHIATDLLQPAGNLPNMIYNYFQTSLVYPELQQKLYSVAFVLILVVLTLNLTSRYISYRSGKMLKP